MFFLFYFLLKMTFVTEEKEIKETRFIHRCPFRFKWSFHRLDLESECDRNVSSDSTPLY